MEKTRGKRTTRVSKPSTKDGKAVKAQSAAEEARREALRENLMEKLELEKRALQIVERLLDDNVTEDFLVDCAKHITASNYKDAIEERSIAKMCGYPVCPNILGKVTTQQYRISTKTNKVYDLTERKSFCSNFCYKSSKEFEVQISKTPLWLRCSESLPNVILGKNADGGVHGEELTLTVPRIRKEDIENPPPFDPAALEAPEGPLCADLARGDGGSGGSDEDDEQDFVSSVVSQRHSGPRVHWGDLPKRTDEGEEREGMGRKERQRKKEEEITKPSVDSKEQTESERTETNEKSKGQGRRVNQKEERVKSNACQSDTGETELPGEGGGQERPSVEETIAHLNLCTIHDVPQTTATSPLNTDPIQMRLKENSLPPTIDMHIDPCPAPSGRLRDPGPIDAIVQGDLTSAREGRLTTPSTSTTVAQGGPTPVQQGQPSAGITEVGMSKRGAAGLRGLLKTHRAEPASVRTNVLEHLRRTLMEWRTEETLVFLFGPDYSTRRQEEEEKEEEDEEEEELDEDDLVEAEGRGKAGRRRGDRARPSAPAPDYSTLSRQTKKMEVRVKEFYKGTFVLPEEKNGKDPALPLVDSQAQHLIQKRITAEKLSRCLRDIVGSLNLTMTEVSTDLNKLVRTFRFTNTNIIHKTPQWTIIAVVLLYVLSEVSPAVRESMESPSTVEFLNTLLPELTLQHQDILNLVQIMKPPAH